ncbi:TorD/DmsD family molecular chaperone [Tindallia californiensis]|uniref:Chaperone TorD involved in molybdoenzyme TorA maturation n=1 Tax=Tindallia californiensis TaxID=159292 RepID=A0A1H3K4F4_9FIRM|nr:molecular chaperone TorD family protein [Tindallia californiensis]SDY46404.1 chaperone TorD involved in molybdoenzyme TorA maturation [Tindallia californiensis]
MMEAVNDRVWHYSILSRLMDDQLKYEDIEKLVSCFNAISSENTVPVERLKEKMNQRLLTKQEEDLGVEYAHIFIMPEGVKAYESVYRSKDQLVMQEPWEKVRAFYLNHGLKIEGKKRHPEDHASVELAFMALLLENKQTEEVQKEFLNQHILCWMPQLFKDIKSNPKADFYATVAEYADVFLEQEKRRFD